MLSNTSNHVITVLQKHFQQYQYQQPKFKFCFEKKTQLPVLDLYHNQKNNMHQAKVYLKMDCFVVCVIVAFRLKKQLPGNAIG